MGDPMVDLWERSEELERMRLHMLKVMDSDGDGMVSYDEFMKESSSEDFDKDEEWKSVGEDEDVFTENEFQEYEKLLAQVTKEHEGGEHGDTTEKDEHKEEKDDKEEKGV